MSINIYILSIMLNFANQIKQSISKTNNLSDALHILQAFQPDEYITPRIDPNIQYYRDIVYQDSVLDIVFITWNPCSSSKIHNHPQSGCIMKILKGELREQIYKIDNQVPVLIEENYVYPNQTSYRSHNTLHKIYNDTSDLVTSIHVYSPPNYIATIYN
jgi:predicted metal-dependent enzyme (double-stranded beta helix superfamily)